MVTDDERREVAGHIRQIDCSGFTAHSMDDGDGRSLLCAYIAEAAGVGHAPYYFDAKPLCACLADLIEPEPERTCHVEYKCRKGDIWPRAVCSVCGHDLSHRDAVDDCGEDEVELCPYCPNCGAKVV